MQYSKQVHVTKSYFLLEIACKSISKVIVLSMFLFVTELMMLYLNTALWY